MNANEYNKPEDFKGETINVDAESTIVNEDEEDAQTLASIAKSYSAVRQKEKQNHTTDSISYRITVASNRMKDLEKAKIDINTAITAQRKKIKALCKLSEQLNALGK
jgi:hypothetical protein